MAHARVLRFPPERAFGTLVTVVPGCVAGLHGPPAYTQVEARGAITIPAGSEVRLHIRYEHGPMVNLSVLNALEPDALDHLSMDSCHAPDTELRHLEHLIGLSVLGLRDIEMTDEGVTHIGRLTGLRALFLEDVNVTDGGLAHLQHLTKLRVVTLTGTRVTSVGVSWLRTALPDCEVRRRP